MTKLENNSNEEKYPLQQIVQEQLDIRKKKNKPQLKPHTSNKKYIQWKKLFHTNGNKKKSEVAILISDNTDFKTKTV